LRRGRKRSFVFIFGLGVGILLVTIWKMENSHESLEVIRGIEKDGLFDIYRRRLHRNRILKGDKEFNTTKFVKKDWEK